MSRQIEAGHFRGQHCLGTPDGTAMSEALHHFFGLMSTMEWIAFMTNVVCVYLIVIEKNVNWPIGVFGSLALIYVFWKIHLYAQVGLQIFYVVESLYGWWKWTRRDDLGRPLLRIGRSGREMALGLSAVGLLATAACYWVFMKGGKLWPDSADPGAVLGQRYRHCQLDCRIHAMPEDFGGMARVFCDRCPFSCCFRFAGSMGHVRNLRLLHRSMCAGHDRMVAALPSARARGGGTHWRDLRAFKASKPGPCVATCRRGPQPLYSPQASQDALAGVA